ncbi:hypothetical protein M422DRAFT_781016 [Sphaerobolus stellatus SS14]|uniref:VIT domain-containing protein n=1 Tax=Sphaerobolus stellatus (strain SS14) TaxID=990650 RepID=A0A0C9VNV8_SPHS4|nr:hypothetical protein M422DRAFT_781016 [Sphaerobolus stellatus SS14]
MLLFSATLVQTYAPTTKEPIEVKYVFPLSPDASICSFKAVVDGTRTIKGVVREKSKAKLEYNEVIAAGKAAVLFEQSNVEIFKVSFGNIHATQSIEINLCFACIISHNSDLDSLHLTLPAQITPRYGNEPGELNDDDSFLAGDDAVVDNNVLEFSMAVQMSSYIKSITSPSHPIGMKFGTSTEEPSVGFDSFRACISLSSPAFLEKAIVITLTCQDLDKPRCTFESFLLEEGAQENTEASALTLVPRFELPPLPAQEYIFLVDRSGSMYGGRIEAVRSALQIMLRSLPTRGTSFNIISFGSQHSSLWKTSVPYTAETVKEASKHVDSMSADFGSTEIRSAIVAAIKSRSDAATPTAIFVLTDGEAWDLEGVESVVTQTIQQSNASNSLLRLFCMGLGDSVSKAMCDLIARAGRGVAVYVQEKESFDQKLMGLLRAARSAVVEDITGDWGVAQEDLPNKVDEDEFEIMDPRGPLSGPQHRSILSSLSNALSPIHSGFRTSVFAIIRRDNRTYRVPKTVRLKGTALGRQVDLEVPVMQAMVPKVSVTEKIKMVHVLAARALIQRLESEPESDRTKDEIVHIAECYGLVSSQTSFLAIDEGGKVISDQEIGTEMAASVTGAGPGGRNRTLGIARSSTGGKAARKQLAQTARKTAVASVSVESISASGKSSSDSESEESGMKSVVNPLIVSVEDFARAQSFEGFFEESLSLCEFVLQASTLPVPPEELKELSNSQIEKTVEKTLDWVYETLQTSMGPDKAAEIKDILMVKAIKFISESRSG